MSIYTEKTIFSLLETFDHNKLYLNRYIKFIKFCDMINRTKMDEYTELHHIYPKCLFPEYTSLKEFPFNGLKLTARQHFIAHWIFSKIYYGREKHKAIKAFFRMTISSKDHKRYNSISYEYAKKAHSNTMKINNPMFNEQIKQKSKELNKNSWTEEKRKRVSESRKGVNNLTPEGIEKLSKFWKGVSRPKTPQHIENNIKAQSCGVYHTPFGDFFSPNQASKNPNNLLGLSPYQIKKKIFI